MSKFCSTKLSTYKNKFSKGVAIQMEMTYNRPCKMRFVVNLIINTKI
nr:MAG TPA: hypothetical protein [Caudoviricetes sp.]